MKHLESAALARGKGVSEPGHPSGLLPVFSAWPRATPFQGSISWTVKWGERWFLPCPDLPSQDGFRGSAQKMESGYFVNLNVEMVFL